MKKKKKFFFFQLLSSNHVKQRPILTIQSTDRENKVSSYIFFTLDSFMQSNLQMRIIQIKCVLCNLSVVPSTTEQNLSAFPTIQPSHFFHTGFFSDESLWEVVERTENKQPRPCCLKHIVCNKQIQRLLCQADHTVR